MVFGFGEKKKEAPKAEDFLTTAGPTVKAAKEFKAAKVAFKKEQEKPKKAPPENMAVRLSSTSIFKPTPRQKDIFDPSKSFPGVVPFWTKKEKRLM